MAKMKTDCDTDFRKSFRKLVFQRFKIGSKVVEILQNGCCSMDILQEIAFNHLVNSFKQISRDGVPLR